MTATSASRRRARDARVGDRERHERGAHVESVTRRRPGPQPGLTGSREGAARRTVGAARARPGAANSGRGDSGESGAKPRRKRCSQQDSSGKVTPRNADGTAGGEPDPPSLIAVWRRLAGVPRPPPPARRRRAPWSSGRSRPDGVRPPGGVGARPAAPASWSRSSTPASGSTTRTSRRTSGRTPARCPATASTTTATATSTTSTAWTSTTAATRPEPQRRHGHGTHVAGTIAAAANGRGVVGVASGAADDRQGARRQRRRDTGAVAEAIRYAVANGAQIINLSWAAVPRRAVATRSTRPPPRRLIVVPRATSGITSTHAFYPVVDPRAERRRRRRHRAGRRAHSCRTSPTSGGSPSGRRARRGRPLDDEPGGYEYKRERRWPRRTSPASPR